MRVSWLRGSHGISGEVGIDKISILALRNVVMKCVCDLTYQPNGSPSSSRRSALDHRLSLAFRRLSNTCATSPPAASVLVCVLRLLLRIGETFSCMN